MKQKNVYCSLPRSAKPTSRTVYRQAWAAVAAASVPANNMDR